MNFKAENIKKIYFKGYKNIALLENVIKYLQEKNPSDLKITVVGKVNQFCDEKNIESSTKNDQLKDFWGKLLGNFNNFGSFVNSEIGNVFIAGTLASTFLKEINGKTLGTLSSGPFAIIRGMGASEIQTSNFFKMLDDGNYLIIFRGFEDEIKNYEKILN